MRGETGRMKKIIVSVFFLIVIAALVFSQQAQSGLTEARVRRVVDGDTIVLNNGERVRLIGINAPELGQPGANEALQFVKERIEGSTVWLEADGENHDRYGRLRRYVWLQRPADTQNENQIRQYQLNAMLLENGLAGVMIIGNVKNAALFRRLASASLPSAAPPASPLAVQNNFIGNRNSHVFHTSGCDSLPSQHNRIYFERREDAVRAGYRVCHRCNL